MTLVANGVATGIDRYVETSTGIIGPAAVACTDAEDGRILRGMTILQTAEEFAETKFDLPEAGRWCELVSGEVRQFEPPDDTHGTVVLNLTKALGVHRHKSEATSESAYACYELGLVTCRDPDTVRCPPVSVFVGGPAFEEMDRELTEARPGLVVELATSNQRRAEMADRVLEWHAWGVPCVWIVNSLDKSVHVALPGQVTTAYADNELLDGNPALPGLEFPVKDLFVEPDWWTRPN